MALSAQTAPNSRRAPFPGDVRFVFCVALILVIGLIDWASGPEIALSILYLGPVLLAVWNGGAVSGVAASTIAAIVWLLMDVLAGATYSHFLIPYWNALVRLGIFLLVAFLFDQALQLNANLNSIVAQRTAALKAEIDERKALERIITEVSASEQERLAGELHDELGAHLAGVGFMAKAVVESLEARQSPEVAEAREMVSFLNRASQQVRGYCRLMAPIDALSGGLRVALNRLADDVETIFGVTCIIQIGADLPELSQDRAKVLYRITQEAVRGAVLESKANEIEINVQREADKLTLSIRNDQAAFSKLDARATEVRQRVMRYRADLLGGEIKNQTDASGNNVITCQIPLDAREAAQRMAA